MAAPQAGGLALELEAAYGNTFSHTWHARALHEERGLGRAPFTREEAETLHARHPGDTIAFLDGEVTRLALRAAVGLGGGASVSLEVPWISFGALALDAGVESFHAALGLPAAQRDEFPRGRFQVVQQRPGGALEFQDAAPGAGLGDAVLGLLVARAPDERTLVAARLVLKLPTGDADAWRGSGSLDAGLLVGARRALTRALALRAEAGVVVPGRFRGRVPATFAPVPFLRALGAVEVRASARTTLSAAAVFEQSPERRDGRADAGRTSLEATLGVATRLDARTSASLSLTENLPKWGDAADVAVRLALRVAP